MISRRILRVKVMQVLFSHEISGEERSDSLEKMLLMRIDKTKQLYYVYLQYLIEVCQYALVDAAKRANKHIQGESDVNINTTIAHNSIITGIQASEHYKRILNTQTISSFIDQKLVKELFKKLQASDKYVKFCEIKKHAKADEVEILRYISKKIIGASHSLDEHLAEYFMGLEDDHFITLHSLQKKLKDYAEMDEHLFLKSFLLEVEDIEEIEFSKDLLSNNLNHRDELNKIIEPRLKNWDMDRVAVMDIILIQLAVTEFLFLPHIPLKVSLNEYIDISKEYSTSKSKDFINGILDKVMKVLNDEGKIQKLGRGLINN